MNSSKMRSGLRLIGGPIAVFVYFTIIRDLVAKEPVAVGWFVFGLASGPLVWSMVKDTALEFASKAKSLRG